jgi:putative ATPase
MEADRAGPARGDAPLAERMRPRTLADLRGQLHLLGETKLLRRAIVSDKLPSMILWGPPGVGKTSLAHVLAAQTQAAFVVFSAVLGSLAELRTLIAAAKEARAYHGKRTLLFVDEIHRFSKSQQDAFLPHVEAGVITLVGATTENPSFSINAALLSRCKVFRLEKLAPEELQQILAEALTDVARGLGSLGLTGDAEALAFLAAGAEGDVRRALTSLESCARYVADLGHKVITKELLLSTEEYRPLAYDKEGDEHYGIVSALIKSMRGSDPDAALYWATRMLESGDDPAFVLRRLIIFASEDVGNADPRALLIAMNADAAFRRLGLPEGNYAIAQAVTYLASAPKSNASYQAYHRARALHERFGSLPVPKHLRPSSNAMARKQGHGAEYKYPHSYEGGVVPGETYLPQDVTRELESERLGYRYLYEPTQRGEELKIAARLAALRKPPEE